MPQASDDLCCLDKQVARRILYKLRWLSQNFGEIVPDRLAGGLKGFYKLRVGTYRVIYTVNDEERLLVVHLIGHRRDIYKR